jgi:hypothetical protein
MLNLVVALIALWGVSEATQLCFQTHLFGCSQIRLNYSAFTLGAVSECDEGQKEMSQVHVHGHVYTQHSAQSQRRNTNSQVAGGSS